MIHLLQHRGRHISKQNREQSIKNSTAQKAWHCCALQSTIINTTNYRVNTAKEVLKSSINTVSLLHYIPAYWLYTVCIIMQIQDLLSFLYISWNVFFHLSSPSYINIKIMLGFKAGKKIIFRLIWPLNLSFDIVLSPKFWSFIMYFNLKKQKS